MSKTPWNMGHKKKKKYVTLLIYYLNLYWLNLEVDRMSACLLGHNNWIHCNTVETLYSTIYYSKYFIELNIDKSTLNVALWTHKRHPYLALSGELWSVFYEYFNRNWSCYKGFLLYVNSVAVCHNQEVSVIILSLIAKFMGPTWGPSGADRTQVGPMLVPMNFAIWVIYWCMFLLTIIIYLSIFFLFKW